MNWGQTKQNKRNIQSTRIIIIVDIGVHSLWLLLKLSFLSLNPLSPELDKVSFLLSISQTDFGKSLVKPRIKVGREYVNQGRNMQQVFFVNSSCKIHVLYETLYLSQIHRTLKHYPWNVFENLLTQSNIYPKSLVLKWECWRSFDLVVMYFQERILKPQVGQTSRLNLFTFVQFSLRNTCM